MLNQKNVQTAFNLARFTAAFTALMTKIQAWVIQNKPTIGEIYSHAAMTLNQSWGEFTSQLDQVAHDLNEEYQKVLQFDMEQEKNRVYAELESLVQNMRNKIRQISTKENGIIQLADEKSQKVKDRIKELKDLMRTWKIQYLGDESMTPEIVTTSDFAVGTLKWLVVIGVPEIIVGALITAFMSNYLTGIGFSILMVFCYTAPAIFGAQAQAKIDHNEQATDRYGKIYGDNKPEDKDGNVILPATLNQRERKVKRVMVGLMNFVVISVTAFRAYTWWSDTNSTLGMLTLFMAVILGVVTYIIYFRESSALSGIPLSAANQYDEWDEELQELEPPVELEEEEKDYKPKRRWFKRTSDEDENTVGTQSEYERKIEAIDRETSEAFKKLQEKHRSTLNGISTACTNLRTVLSMYGNTRKQFKSAYNGLVATGIQYLPGAQKQPVNHEIIDTTFETMIPNHMFMSSAQEVIDNFDVKTLNETRITPPDVYTEAAMIRSNIQMGVIERPANNFEVLN